jgi:hypothetical protein
MITGGLLALGPLLFATLQDPSWLRAWAGLPETLPSVSTFLHNLLHVPTDLFLRAQAFPAMRLGKLPLLSLAETMFTLLGIYAYGLTHKLDRTRLLAVILIGSWLLIGLGGPVTSTILLPFVYLLIAAGLGYLLRQWFIIFPRNPLARTLATSLLSVLVFLVAAYHLTQYFIAWPNAPATNAAYTAQPVSGTIRK